MRTVQCWTDAKTIARSLLECANGINANWIYSAVKSAMHEEQQSKLLCEYLSDASDSDLFDEQRIKNQLLSVYIARTTRIKMFRYLVVLCGIAKACQ